MAVFIKVKAHPASREEKIIQKSENSFHVHIKAKPRDGAANEATARALSEYFQIPQSKIKLIKGGRKRNKIFEIL